MKMSTSILKETAKIKITALMSLKYKAHNAKRYHEIYMKLARILERNASALHISDYLEFKRITK